jgi:hypothetical protein
MMMAASPPSRRSVKDHAHQEWMYQIPWRGCDSVGTSLLSENTQATIIAVRTTTYVPRATVPSIAAASVFFCQDNPRKLSRVGVVNFWLIR